MSFLLILSIMLFCFLIGVLVPLIMFWISYMVETDDFNILVQTKKVVNHIRNIFKR